MTGAETDVPRREASGAGDSEETARRQLRGSGVLLSGRAISVGVKFAAQLLVVRYLAQADYGAWTYGLSAVAFFQGLSSLGLKRGVSRFLPIYHEKEDYGRFFGTLVMVAAAIVLAGTVIVGGYFAFPDLVTGLVSGEGGGEPLRVLTVMIFLVPLEAVDRTLTDLFASFSESRAIFLRRYVLTPGLRLGLVVLLIFLDQSVLFLAMGYLVATLAGIVAYLAMLVPLLRREGLLEAFRPRALELPWREVLSYTVPLMTTDWVTSLTTSAGPLLLGYFSGMSDVALFRVVLPLATANQLVLQSFGLLYKPTASRQFAQGDLEGIRHHYWRTAVWVAVLAFPIFAVTFAGSGPLTEFLYGARYAESGTILSLLAFGYYFNAVLGFNGMTLKVVGKVREVVVINVLAAVSNVGLNLALIPQLGVLGAGIGTAGSLVIHNLLKHAALRIATGLPLFDPEYAVPYAVLGGGFLALLGLLLASPGGVFVTVPLALLVSLAVFLLAKGKLRIGETFPELARIPLLRPIVT